MIEDDREWLLFTSLVKGDLVQIRTMNSLYTMKVIDPGKGLVSITSNGEASRFEEPTEVRVLGARLSVGPVAPGLGIKIGYGLDLRPSNRPERDVHLSPVQEVHLNAQKVLP